MQNIENITQHIIAYNEGDKVELSVIVDALYVELCNIAKFQLNKLNAHAITPQELVHEVYLKFAKSSSANANGRKHFLAIAATAMRYFIIDQIRSENSEKQGGYLCATTLSDSKIPIHDNVTEILYIDQAIEKLRKLQPQLATTIECRYFAGYSEIETAEALDVNVRTVRRYWKRAKRWLAIEFTD